MIITTFRTQNTTTNDVMNILNECFMKRMKE